MLNNDRRLKIAWQCSNIKLVFKWYKYLPRTTIFISFDRCRKLISEVVEQFYWLFNKEVTFILSDSIFYYSDNLILTSVFPTWIWSTRSAEHAIIWIKLFIICIINFFLVYNIKRGNGIMSEKYRPSWEKSWRDVSVIE